MMTTTFTIRNRVLAATAQDILALEHPMTLRQLYYRCVSCGLLNNAQAEYKRLGAIMTRLRESGEVPLPWIVDHVRATLKPSSWTGLGDFRETVVECYRKDLWANAAAHVEVFVEKDAIAGTIQPVTAELDIALRVCRGFSSISFAGEIADVWRRVRKPIFAYYLGDFDPSGFEIERDLRDKLTRYSGGRRFHWSRLAVTFEDFETQNLIQLPVKNKDSRAARFLREHGSVCAEVDAIAPTELRRRVESAIMQHIDQDKWELLRLTERLEQESLASLTLGWGQ
jgi:hypothetical protein